jgi:hypothetical protein
MHFQLSVISQLMREVPREVFNNAVVGRSKWGLTEWSHLVTLVAAQLAGMRSLRDLVDTVISVNRIFCRLVSRWPGKVLEAGACVKPARCRAPLRAAGLDPHPRLQPRASMRSTP